VKPTALRLAAVAAGVVLISCSTPPTQPAQPAPAPPAQPAQPAASSANTETAEQFVARINEEMADQSKELSAAGWVQATYITDDTQLLNARANERFLEYFSKAVEEAGRYEGQKLDPNSARSIELLKLGVAAPAPNDPVKRKELSEITSRMEAMYGEGKYCPKGPESCKNLDDLEDILARSRQYDEITDAWVGWHTISKPMRKDYVRFVELANEGARTLGYKDLGTMWRSGYDMPPEAFEQETERLWGQVKPLYDQLQCYARGRLAKKYGEDKVPAGKPIPAQLFGNMWAQQWNKIYPDILEPYHGVANLDVDKALKAQKYDARRMAQSAETFYTSLGFPPLPATFWDRSMLTRPRDREVVCHASAWSMDGKDDVRIKQCIKPTEEDLATIYHELGHVFYYLSYRDQPYLYQSGANDGFHEAIGDTIVLSMTPGYLHTIKLVGDVKPSREAVINQQMKLAADKIAFLPFGKLIDQWRWGVFSGKIRPEDYNKAWWELRTKYQGIAPPVARTEEDFDPGAKYHIPANTPYTRYFLSFILQFQFHRALCEAAGFKGPLHECSIFGNREAGRRFEEMLALGQSKPWPEALEKLTGSRQMDASAIIDYFQPLMGWLKEENAGRKCGWEGE
jgi:peptidyl-dipeptidase A